MWQALALRMGATLEELRSRMSHREFVYWRRVYQERPFSDERCYDLPHAFIRLELRRVMGGAKGEKVEQFLPYRPKPENLSDIDEQIISNLGD